MYIYLFLAKVQVYFLIERVSLTNPNHSFISPKQYLVAELVNGWVNKLFRDLCNEG